MIFLIVTGINGMVISSNKKDNGMELIRRKIDPISTDFSKRNSRA